MPIKVRSVILPVCNLGSQLSMPLLIIGLIFDFYFLVKLGVIFFCVALLFQLLTLPIEFNASHRALVTLDSSGLIREDEQKAVRRVLSAAAMNLCCGAGLYRLRSLYDFWQLPRETGGNFYCAALAE